MTDRWTLGTWNRVWQAIERQTGTHEADTGSLANAALQTLADADLLIQPRSHISVAGLRTRVDALKARRDEEPDTTARMIMTVRIDTIEQLIRETENS